MHLVFARAWACRLTGTLPEGYATLQSLNTLNLLMNNYTVRHSALVAAWPKASDMNDIFISSHAHIYHILFFECNPLLYPALC